MPVTHVDVARLAAQLGHTDGWLEWLAPGAIDLEGETECLVELREGPRLLVLAQVRDSKQRAACALHRENEGCGVYPQRPACCRTYPFEPREPFRDGPDDVRRVHLELHHDVLCDPETGIAAWSEAAGRATNAKADDGQATRDALYEATHRELATYIARVSEWNRRQRRRRLAGRLPQSGEEFVQTLLR